MQVMFHDSGHAAATILHRAADTRAARSWWPMHYCTAVHVSSLVVLMLQEVGPYTDGSPAGPKCAQQANVPFSSWWSSTAMCSSPNTTDTMPQNSTGVKRGQRYFVRDPRALANPRPLGIGNVVDLKPFLSKYAYSIALDVLAANAVNNRAKGATDRCDSMFG